MWRVDLIVASSSETRRCNSGLSPTICYARLVGWVAYQVASHPNPQYRMARVVYPRVPSHLISPCAILYLAVPELMLHRKHRSMYKSTHITAVKPSGTREFKPCSSVTSWQPNAISLISPTKQWRFFPCLTFRRYPLQRPTPQHQGHLNVSPKGGSAGSAGVSGPSAVLLSLHSSQVRWTKMEPQQRACTKTAQSLLLLALLLQPIFLRQLARLDNLGTPLPRALPDLG